MRSSPSIISRSQTRKVAGWTVEIGAPRHPLPELQALVKDRFGIDGRLTALEGERDQNALVRDRGSGQWVLKVSQGPDPTKAAEFQAALLLHLEENAPELPLPRNIATSRRESFFTKQFDNGQTGAVRLVTYLEGRPVADDPNLDLGWAGHIGVFQGKLCTALKGFDHSGADRFMPWDASSVVMLKKEMLDFVEPSLGDLVAPHIDRLRSQTLPLLRTLSSQVIHNDLHPGNILMDASGRISGVIDFGDAIRGPLVQDLAVSANSLIETFPFHHEKLLADLVTGFTSHCPIGSEELALLYDAILLRSILSVALGRMKDQQVAPLQRPRPATAASEAGLIAILNLKDSAVWDALQ